MNLAEIRKKAQQQEAPRPGWEEVIPAAAAPSEPVVELVPVSFREAPLAAPPAPEDMEETFPQPVLECVLGEYLPGDEEEIDSDTQWPTVALPQESLLETVDDVLQEEEAPAASEAPVPAPKPAAVQKAAPAPVAAQGAPAPFDPLSAILKGREEAAAGEGAGVAVEEEGAVSVELLCFKVAQEEYAISIMDVKEIIKPRELTEVPRTPPFVGGVLSLRGIIIPVFDLRVRLGLSLHERSPRERIVVVKRERGFCGVLVDQVVQVVRLPLAGFEPPPLVLEGIDRDFVQGIGRVDGRMLILLDMEKVLDVTLS